MRPTKPLTSKSKALLVYLFPSLATPFIDELSIGFGINELASHRFSQRERVLKYFFSPFGGDAQRVERVYNILIPELNGLPITSVVHI